MKTVRAKFNVPIFDADVVLEVAEDIHEARRRYDKWFHGSSGVDLSTAWCEYTKIGRFGLFFQKDSVSLRVVSHELFHLTSRIMKWCSVKDEEAGALLHEQLVHTVFKILRKHGWNR